MQKKRANLKVFSPSKDAFPSLLNKLHTNVQNNAVANLKFGLERCEIYLLNKKRALPFIPRRNACTDAAKRNDQVLLSALNDSLLTLLEGMRFNENASSQTRKRKRLNLEPGKSC